MKAISPATTARKYLLIAGGQVNPVWRRAILDRWPKDEEQHPRVHHPRLLAATSPAIAQADTLVPARGRTVDLDAVHGIAYYTVEKSGFRVVAALAEPGNTPVRMEVVLPPAQAVILSSPKGQGEGGIQVEIARRNDGTFRPLR